VSAPLYSLTGRYQALLEIAEQGEDVSAALGELDDAIEAKAVNVCKVLAQLEADALASDAEATRLAARSKTYANGAERLRQYIKACMTSAKIRSIKSPQFSITISPGQDKVVITDISKIPKELMRQPKTPLAEPDKAAILAAYKADGTLPSGVEIHETTTLRIR